MGQRAFFVLLSDAGKEPQEIAQQTGCHENTVKTWLKRYQQAGLQGLRSQSPPGRPNVKGKAIVKVINEVISNSPTMYGYKGETWSAGLLRDYFQKQGINAGEDTIKRALKKLGVLIVFHFHNVL